MFKEVLTFRTVTESDIDFLRTLYISTRYQEVQQVGWSKTQIDEFLTMQFNAQHQFYLQQFKHAQFDVVECDGEAAGRLYLDYREDEIRIVDIALLPEFRGKGLGSRLLNQIISDAKEKNIVVRIHVEKNNPALTLYQRLGFVEIEDKGVYLLMQKTPGQCKSAVSV